MSVESDLLVGLAGILDLAEVADWRPSGSYTAEETAIVIEALPDSPDRVVSFSQYAVADDPTLSDSTVGVQIRTRWGGADPTGARDLDSRIFDLLHGMPAQTVNGVRVVTCTRRSSTTLGQDQVGRWERTSNYYLDIHRPSTNRT